MVEETSNQDAAAAAAAAPATNSSAVETTTTSVTEDVSSSEASSGAAPPSNTATATSTTTSTTSLATNDDDLSQNILQGMTEYRMRRTQSLEVNKSTPSDSNVDNAKGKKHKGVSRRNSLTHGATKVLTAPVKAVVKGGKKVVKASRRASLGGGGGSHHKKKDKSESSNATSKSNDKNANNNNNYKDEEHSETTWVRENPHGTHNTLASMVLNPHSQNSEATTSSHKNNSSHGDLMQEGNTTSYTNNNNTQWTSQNLVSNFSNASNNLVRTTVKGPMAAGKLMVQQSFRAGHAVVNAGKLGTNAVVEAGKMGTNAVVGAGTMATNTVVNATNTVVTATVDVTHKASHAVVDAGTAVGQSLTTNVKHVSSGVMYGSKAIVVGSGTIVGQSGKTVVKGARGMVKGVRKRASNLSQFGVLPMRPSLLGGKPAKSKWEEGLEVIDALLEPESATYEAMTPLQRKQLANVKKYLLQSTAGTFATTGANQSQHVPVELIQLQRQAELLEEDEDGILEDDDSVVYGSDEETEPGVDLGYGEQQNSSKFARRASRRQSRNASLSKVMRRNSNFILQEYAGLNVKKSSSMDMTKHAKGNNEQEQGDSKQTPLRTATSPARLSITVELDEQSEASSSSSTASVAYDDPTNSEVTQDDSAAPTSGSVFASPAIAASTRNNASASSKAAYYVPPEFTFLSNNEQQELAEMLSWKSLKQWNYDIFRLHELTQGHGLLFMGWAVLGSPYAQEAMRSELGLSSAETERSDDRPQGYTFMDELHIPPEKLCNYLRAIEADYQTANPYHNAIHASDVVQSLHTLIQMASQEEFIKEHCSSIQLFAILLASVVHDVDHGGKTNAFYVKLRTELAVMYNDKSVLENWHVAHAFARMLDMDLRQATAATINTTFSGTSSTGSNGDAVFLPPHCGNSSHFRGKNSENNILCNASDEQFDVIRKHMIEAVLHTDMTNHFAMVNGAKGMLLEEDPAKEAENAWRVLMYMLHLADISGQAKSAPFFLLWTDRCMEEFFQQGDQESKLGMPISPNCDRNSTVPAESQMGFIEYVVEPAYRVLGMYIPFVQDIVLPILHDNLDYWISQQADLLVDESEEKESSEGDGDATVEVIAKEAEQNTDADGEEK